MANLKFNEKQLFEKLFDRGGYVLNFSNRTKVKQLPDWSLSSLIDVAHEKGFIGLHVKNKQKYIDPLTRLDFIEFTIPDNPTDKKQKYRLTLLGKNFIKMLQ